MLKYQPTFLDRTFVVEDPQLRVRVPGGVSHRRRNDDLTPRAAALAGYVGSLVHDDHLDVARTPIGSRVRPSSSRNVCDGCAYGVGFTTTAATTRRYGRVFNPAGAWAKGSPVTARTERMDPYTAAGRCDVARVEVDAPRQYRELLTVVINVVLGAAVAPLNSRCSGEDSASPRGLDVGGRPSGRPGADTTAPTPNRAAREAVPGSRGAYGGAPGPGDHQPFV